MYGSLILSGKRYTLAIASQLQTKEPKHRGHKRRQGTYAPQYRCFSFCCCRCLCSRSNCQICCGQKLCIQRHVPVFRIKNAGIVKMFLQDQGRKPSKTPLFTLSFSQCVENNIFCDDFFDKGVEMYCKYQYFIHFYCFQLPKQTSHAQFVFAVSTLTRQNSQIHDVFEAIFDMFSARAPQCKKQSFLDAFLPPLIRTQEGVKIAKYCQTKPKMDILFVTIFATKFWLKKLGEAVWAQKCCKLQCVTNLPRMLPAK